MKSFTTSRGITVEILAIQTLLEKFEAATRLPRVPDELKSILGDAMPKPEAPTYDVKAATGAIETYLHDETTVATPEEKAALAKYQADLAAYNQDHAEKQKRLVFLHGMRVSMPDNDDWAKAQAELGIDVPTDETARKLHYIETEVIGGVGDYLEIMKQCTLAGLMEEQRPLAEAMFQREMGQYLAGGPADTEGALDNQLPIREGAGGDTGGTDAAIPVRRVGRGRPGRDHTVLSHD